MGLYLGAACKLNLWTNAWEKVQALELKHQKTALKLFVSVPSLLPAHPFIDTVSWHFPKDE